MLFKSFASLAARRLASDPRVRAKARALAAEQVLPAMERRVKAVQKTYRQAEPGIHPARLAGRAVRRLIDG